MITGSNTNVRYRGRIFHVQTEDSGRHTPRIISHLYHGGTILASEKTEYETDHSDEQVRKCIEEQHKRMLGRLKKGEFDALIAERLEDGGADTASGGSVTDIPDTDPQLVPGVSEGETAPPPAEAGEGQRAFGDGIVSQKPLDEVILDYLVEKARERSKKRRDSRPGG